jgi:ATP-binding cassette, subfamily B, bacterial PglK
MNKPFNLINLSKRYWFFLEPRRKKSFFILLLLMTLASISEMLSIGALIPFIMSLTDPSRLLGSPKFESFIYIFQIKTASQLTLWLTIVFIAAVLFAAALRITQLWAFTRLTFAISNDLSTKVYRNILHQPYSFHIAKNSSEVISRVIRAGDVSVSLIQPVINIINSAIMLAMILTALLFMNPFVALYSFASFSFIYLIIIKFTKGRLLIESEKQSAESIAVLEVLQGGLGGIRDVIINTSQKFYYSLYKYAFFKLQRANGNVQIISSSPRSLVEAFGIITLAFLAYLLQNDNNLKFSTLPILGALVLGIQRVLPLMQLSYYSFSTIRGSQSYLEDTLNILELESQGLFQEISVDPIPFTHSIFLKNISFKYSEKSPYILKDINIKIPKGSRVGFIGITGSGKSTLLDILMGLQPPSYGAIEVDGKVLTKSNLNNWRARLAHVPQSIFLADCSIEENIAFGVPKDLIDHNRVVIAARRANISETIDSLEQGYQTFTGERGVRLSGGQRQRIGIARALYKNADVLFFDEATSALDNETERSVIESINNLDADITVFMVAHRTTTLKSCTHIFKVSKGNIETVR